MTSIIAVDTGGTFTDLVIYDPAERRFVSKKSLTTYDNLVRGVTDCIEKAGLDVESARGFKFGTTLVINSFVQRSGARTALVATRGFRDILELGRGNRKLPYDLRYRRHEPLVPRELRFGVTERTGGDGTMITPLDLADLETVARAIEGQHPPIEAIAVSFLNAYLNDVNERDATTFLKQRLPGVYVTSGSELSREWYEYERTCTAVANAYVGPRVIDYVAQLEAWLRARSYRHSFFLMASNGGVYSTTRAQRQPVMLLESGPVGGCIGAAAYGERLGIGKIIAFDMGGTTAKACAVQDGHFDIESTYYVGGADHGFPIQGSVLDIVEVGAGGGSIAKVDPQGRLSVGPQSAGSAPGPVCYGNGGLAPTITDANVALGRLGETAMIGGEMTLDGTAATRAIGQQIAAPMGLADDVDRAAQGILDIAALVMADAIKEVTIVKGLDPRDFALMVYGGGGPLHGADLARELGIARVIVPQHPGAFSSVGMLMADARIDERMSFFGELTEAILPAMREHLSAMEVRLADALSDEIGTGEHRFAWEAGLQYKSQAHTLRIPIAPDDDCAAITAAFNAAYRKRYGHANAGSPIAFVGLVVVGTARMESPVLMPQAAEHDTASRPASHRSVYFKGLGRLQQTPVYRRDEMPVGTSLNGPAIVEEYGSTTVIAPGDRLEVGRFGELDIRIAGSSEPMQEGAA